MLTPGSNSDSEAELIRQSALTNFESVFRAFTRSSYILQQNGFGEIRAVFNAMPGEQMDKVSDARRQCKALGITEEELKELARVFSEDEPRKMIQEAIDRRNMRG